MVATLAGGHAAVVFLEAAGRPVDHGSAWGLERLYLDQIRGFVMGLELPTGGFRAGLWDNVADVEYTFYGLGTVALLDH